MLKKIVLFWTHSYNLQFLRLSILLILTQIGLIIYFFENLPPQIPLYFSLAWGERRLAQPQELLTLPILSLSILLFNSFLALFLDNKNILLTKLLLSVPVIISLLSAISVIQIVRLSL